MEQKPSHSPGLVWTASVKVKDLHANFLILSTQSVLFILQENIVSKLEQMGFRVGQRMIERSTRETPRFSTELDIIKFVCKDFWSGAFKKQVDNLRTNHQVSCYLLNINKSIVTKIHSVLMINIVLRFVLYCLTQ